MRCPNDWLYVETGRVFIVVDVWFFSRISRKRTGFLPVAVIMNTWSERRPHTANKNPNSHSPLRRAPRGFFASPSFSRRRCCCRLWFRSAIWTPLDWSSILWFRGIFPALYRSLPSRSSLGVVFLDVSRWKCLFPSWANLFFASWSR